MQEPLYGSNCRNTDLWSEEVSNPGIYIRFDKSMWNADLSTSNTGEKTLTDWHGLRNYHVASNPLRRLEEEYSLLILQYLHLNPKDRSLEQICTSIGCKKPSQVIARLNQLGELGLVYREMGEGGIENHYVLTKRGRRASELVWDLFHIIQSFSDDEYGKDDILRFYR